MMQFFSFVCDTIVSHCLVEEVLDASTASEGGRILSKEYGRRSENSLMLSSEAN